MMKYVKIPLQTIPKKRIVKLNVEDIEKYEKNDDYIEKIVIEGDKKLIKEVLKSRKDLTCKIQIKDLKLDIQESKDTFIDKLKKEIKNNDLEEYWDEIEL